MFAIYDNGNMIFRNSADNLSKYNKVRSTQKSELNPDDENLYEENLYEDFLKKKKKSQNEAINSYKKIANLDTSEPVYHVKDIMTKDTITIDINSSLMQAYETLKEHKVSHIPVLTSDKKIVGTIHNKKILDELIESNSNPLSLLTKKISTLYFDEIMTTDPLSDIRRVAQVMIKYKINTFPVVEEDGFLVGIVSKTDIIKAVSHLPHLQLWS